MDPPTCVQVGVLASGRPRSVNRLRYIDSLVATGARPRRRPLDLWKPLVDPIDADLVRGSPRLGERARQGSVELKSEGP